MKRKIDLGNWNRKEHFNFFSKFDEPYYGITVQVDVTELYRRAKRQEISFYLSYLHGFLTAINNSEPLRTRIIDGTPYIFDRIDVSATVDRPDDTFGFSYITYDPDFDKFATGAREKIMEVRSTTSLFPGEASEHVVHFSALPWIDFTAVSHARNFVPDDGTPKISVGKMKQEGDRKMMPLSIHVHHGLVDGIHLGKLLDDYQQILNA